MNKLLNKSIIEQKDLRKVEEYAGFSFLNIWNINSNILEADYSLLLCKINEINLLMKCIL